MIHPNHTKELPQFASWLMGLLASLLVVRHLPTPDAAKGLAGYMPLHITMEVAAISVAAIVFGVAWSIQRYRRDGRAMVLGVAFLGVAILDLSHTLSFSGMPDFVTPSNPEKGINFWLAARSLAAAALLTMAFWPTKWENWLDHRSRWTVLALVLLLVALAHWVFFFHPESMPRTFIEGQGLTPFKVRFEYVLMAVYTLAGIGFLSRLRQERAAGVSRLALASFTMAMSEYFLTLYANITDIYNVVGHVYKIVAYGFLYRALFVDTVQQPYVQLLANEEQLRATLNTLPDLLFEMDRQGRYLAVHAHETHTLTEPVERLLGRRLYDVMPTAAADTCMRAIEEAERTGSSRGLRIGLPLSEGQRHFELSVTRKDDRLSGEAHYLVLSRDVTAVVDNEIQLAFEARLNAALLDLQQHDGQESEPDFLRRGVELAERLTDSQIAFIHFVNDDQNSIELVTWSSATLRDFCTAAYDAHYPVSEAGIWAEALRQRQPVVFNDYATAPHKKGLPQGHAHLQRLISLPALDGGMVRMMIGVGNKADDYTERDVKALQVLADEIWTRVKQHRQSAIIHRLSEALGQSPNPVVITDVQANIQYVNQAFTRVSGYEAHEVLGRNPRVLRSGQTPKSSYEQLWNQLKQGEPWQGEFINRRKNGQLYVERASLYPIKDRFGQITHYVAHKEDVTLQREAENRIRALSDFDALTGLLNKKSFDEHLAQALHQARVEHRRLTLVWFDLDNFKSVNDALGHAAGDELLVETAKRLRDCFDAPAMIARHSRDAFVVILPQVDQATAAIRVNDALTALRESLMIQDHLLSVGASAGIAVFPDDAQTPAALAMAAEVAMYRVKEEGRNDLRFFSPDMQAATERSLELASGLKMAAERGELFLVYQAQRSLRSGQLTGAEALLRWRHPRWGVVSPAEFIPIAEQTGLIVPIGIWIVEQVARQLRHWDEAGLPPLTVSVNVSAVQFTRPHLVEELLHTIGQTGMSPNRFELELTEAVALKAPEAAAVTLQRLHDAGFKVALDDFGTGYSSMSYLKRYAIDKLKIDQSFVKELADGGNDQAIVQAIVQLAHTLGIRTIAEGVETPAQAEVLTRCGCDEIQGFWYSRPLEAPAFEQFVRNGGRQP